MSLNDNPPTRRSLHAQRTPQPLSTEQAPNAEQGPKTEQGPSAERAERFERPGSQTASATNTQPTQQSFQPYLTPQPLRVQQPNRNAQAPQTARMPEAAQAAQMAQPAQTAQAAQTTQRPLSAQSTLNPQPALNHQQPLGAQSLGAQPLGAQPAVSTQTPLGAQNPLGAQTTTSSAPTTPPTQTQPVALLQPKRLTTLSDDQYEFLRTPKMRKKIVIALVASMLLSGILIALSPVLNTAIFIVLLLVVTVGLMTALGGLSIANRGIGEYGEGLLDERQHSLGNAAYKTAYKLLGATVALVISAMFVLNMTDLAIPTSVVGGTLVVLWEAIFALPAIAVALTLKD